LVFREGPVIEKCFEKIRNIPDLIFYDGHGYAHPRRLGIASHMGILLNLPSIGCAKKKLCGDVSKFKIPEPIRLAHNYLQNYDS